MSAIESIFLNKEYKRKKLLIKAVTDVNLKVEAGEIVMLRGRSGAGKSTLLNLLAGLIKPTSGRVIIENAEITGLSNKDMSRILLSKIGIIFQNFNLLPSYSIYENIEVALQPKGLTGKEIMRLAMPYFEQFRLTDKINMLPEELSIGQQQKVAIIRTLIKMPSIILADEPTASVDDETATEILDTLKDMRYKKSVTIILATHGIVPDKFADRIVTMINGELFTLSRPELHLQNKLL